MQPNWTNRTIWTGDNLDVMRGMNSETVDLIYLDTPFNSSRDYAAPIGSEAAGAAFKDTWTLSDVDEAWHREIADRDPTFYAIIDAAGHAHGKGMKSYLIMMAVRLLEMRRLLKPTASIYLHCDPTASHYLTLLDAILGASNFRNEIVWKRTTTHSNSKTWSRVSDSLLFYSRGQRITWNTPHAPHSDEYIASKYRHDDGDGRRYRLDNMTSPNPRPNMMYDWKGFPSPVKRYLDEMKGGVMGNVWPDISPINSQAKERIGYPTQKPLALLDRIIEASSNPGDVVFDPFCGCATACVAAERLQRHWVGIDLSPLAARLVNSRLRDEMGLFFDVSHRSDIPRRTDLGDLPNYRTHKHTLYGRQEGLCAGCRVMFPFRNTTVVPQSRGGSDDIDNLQLLCGACNSMKGTDSQEAFIARLIQQGLRQ